ncbi:MAG: nucleotide exchange factor GrpE, partial [Notoacmeibacter sp.]
MNSDSNKRYGSDEHMDDDALADAMDALEEEDREEELDEEDEAEDEEVDETELLKAEIADLKERYIRLAADMENLRRRTEREVKDARTFAISNFARDVLAVSDDLGRAMQVVRDSQNTEDPLASVAGLVEGIAATERAMITT